MEASKRENKTPALQVPSQTDARKPIKRHTTLHSETEKATMTIESNQLQGSASATDQKSVKDSLQDAMASMDLKTTTGVEDAEAKAPLAEDDGAEDDDAFYFTVPKTIMDPDGETSPLNPDFDVKVQGAEETRKAANARMIEDIEHCERDGALTTLCVACESRGVKYCNGCKHARYCSRACQVADWPIHKLFCKDFAGAASDSARPGPNCFRIAFFPTFNSEPELHWVRPWEGAGSDLSFIFEHHDIDLFLKRAGITEPREHKGKTILNTQCSLGERRIGQALTVITFTLTKPLRKTTSPRFVNKSINALSKPGYLRPWFGPVILYADSHSATSQGREAPRDLTPRSIHSTVRLIELLDCACVADPARYHGEVVAGLRINDPKARLNAAMGVTAVFEPARVPLAPLLTSDYIATLAFHLGLRWYMRPGNLIGARKGVTSWGDANLRYLGFVCCLREKPQPTTPAGVVDVAPSVQAAFNYGPFAASSIVLHGSGRPVHPHHVLAFNGYLDEMVVTRGVASRAGFERFWDRYKAEVLQTSGGGGDGGDGGDGTRRDEDVPSPYALEGDGVPDRMGRFDPRYVRRVIASLIPGIWVRLLDDLNDAGPGAGADGGEYRLRHGPRPAQCKNRPKGGR